jgi:hypothetical protein
MPHSRRGIEPPNEFPDWVFCEVYGIFRNVRREGVKRRTFLVLTGVSSFYSYPCACCDEDLSSFFENPKDVWFFHFIDVCPECYAPMCENCSEFMANSSEEALKIKRCRWCASFVFPSHKINLHAPHFDDLALLLDINRARENFIFFSTWKYELHQKCLGFDLSKIFWASYLDRNGWLFFADAKRFFEQQLKNEYNIVIASILFQASQPSLQVRQKFGEFYRSFQEDPESFLFCQSARLLQMNTFAHKMLARMDRYSSQRYLRYLQHLVLKRLSAGFALKMSNGLGVNILPTCN